MARADGVVASSEIDAFAKVVLVPAEDRANVERLFRLAQATTDGFQAYAAQLARLLADEPCLLENIVDGLFLIAQADGAVHDKEIGYLREVSRIFGKDEAWFEAALSRHVILPDDPYRVLGVDRSMGFTELQRHYRQLVLEHHPDREIARGLPPEAIRIATDRLSAINAAWDRIERERKAA
jgi:DnaJ like chaperone protein